MHYVVEYVLAMPARRFFSMRKSLLEMRRKEQASSYREQCSIAAINGVNSLDYYKELDSYYRRLGMSEAEILKDKNPRLIDADNPEELNRGAKILQGFFDAAR